MRLPADDAEVERFGDAKVAGEIIGHHRLLEPIDVILLKFPPHLDGDVGGPTHVHVDHDVDVGAERLAHAPDVGEVGVQIADVGNLHLDCLVAPVLEVQGLGDHAVAAAAAETAAAVSRQLRATMAPQPMQRQLRPLAERIP